MLHVSYVTNYIIIPIRQSFRIAPQIFFQKDQSVKEWACRLQNIYCQRCRQQQIRTEECDHRGTGDRLRKCNKRTGTHYCSENG